MSQIDYIESRKYSFLDTSIPPEEIKQRLIA